jgi:ABC-type sugar transport system ATPase subunit
MQINTVSEVSSTENPTRILGMRGMVRRFRGLFALGNADCDVRRDQVHALVSENGAGKSTLMKSLFGVYTRDGSGMIFVGKHVNFTIPRQAQLTRITTIYHELNQVPQIRRCCRG